MLVLSRRIGEAIYINSDIKVTVLEIRSERIRLGIEAPQEIGVYREEVWAVIKDNRKLGERNDF